MTKAVVTKVSGESIRIKILEHENEKIGTFEVAKKRSLNITFEVPTLEVPTFAMPTLEVPDGQRFDDTGKTGVDYFSIYGNAAEEDE